MNYARLIFLCTVLVPSPIFARDIIVTVDRFTEVHNNAPVRFSCCTNEDDHNRQDEGYRHIDSELIESTGAYRKYRIKEINPGEYSLAAYHDLDNSGRLERIMRVPQEPIGFSRLDIERIWGHPRWDEVKFQVSEDDTSVVVHLISRFGLF